jgi:ribose 5-phosphate isomerase B
MTTEPRLGVRRRRGRRSRHAVRRAAVEPAGRAPNREMLLTLTRMTPSGMVPDIMVIALGADHAGFVLKEALGRWLTDRGHEVVDVGTHASDSVDYPDYAAAVANAVASGQAARGVLVCGSGIGMAIAANKVAGIRAAACADADIARLSREHNDTNVLALGARTTAADAAMTIVETWLATEFQGGRHARRIDKIAALDRRPGAGSPVHEALHA